MSKKIGLALSGGGFRASFFHIGVLARLAEVGVLREVQVISTVSGGSIVGAAYYMRLQNLLRSKANDELDDADYVALVDRLEETFRAAVGRNIRGLVWANPLKNLQMASWRYSRSDRIGDLYDRWFYKPIWKEAHGDTRARRRFGREEQIRLSELLIETPDLPPGFDPEEVNLDPGRKAKVPILMINATSLNTGHNWRFEAVRMGEPMPRDRAAATVATDVDGNERYGQAYFDERFGTPLVPERQRDFPLGLAVAASACVPTLFHPLAITGMYDGVKVQLVDGGVHDNQGVQALLDRGCSDLILSDASGQMPDVAQPVTRIPAVAGRSISIYGDRIRDEQLVRVEERPEHVEHVALMHLRKGLVPCVRDVGKEPVPDPERTGGIASTDFGVAAETQAALARVRTDLDGFSDVEALTLEYDGYRMTKTVLPGSGIEPETAIGAPLDGDWAFLAPEIAAGAKEPAGGFARRLAAAKSRSFKPLAVLPYARVATAAVVLALVGLLVYLVRHTLLDGFDSSASTWVVVAVVGGLLVLAGSYVSGIAFAPVRIATELLVGTLAPLLFALPLFVVSLLMLGAGRLHLALGRVERRRARQPEGYGVTSGG